MGEVLSNRSESLKDAHRARVQAKDCISEVTCEYWQVLGFIVCIGMYGGLYYGTYWYVLAWYVLWHVLVCIIFGMYYMYW